MELKSKSSLAIVNWAFRVVIAICNTKVTVIGEENVPKDEPVLYIGNHRSFFDIVLTYVRVPRLTGYIAKKEIRKVPLLSHWMVNLHCLFLDRDNIKEGLKTILAAIEKVKSGISICIFPEGTRNSGDEPLLPFHDGSFTLWNLLESASYVSSAPVRSSPFPRMNLTASIACSEPITPPIAPITPA